MTPRTRRLALLAAFAVAAGVAPATASAAFDGSLCPQGTGVLEPADGRLCVIGDRPYGYPDITLTDGSRTRTFAKPANAPAFTGAQVLSREPAPASTLRFDLFRDDANQHAPVVIVEQGGSWLRYEDPILGSYGGNRSWGEHVAKYLAYRGFVAITSDVMSASQHEIRRMGLDPIAREGQRNRQTLVRLLRAEHERFGIDPDRIYATGESAGGAEALRLALRSEDTGDVAARRLGGVNDAATSSHIRGAVAIGASDCGVPGLKPEKLIAGRKVFDWRGDWLKYLAAPDIAPVYSSQVTTFSPSLLTGGAPKYRWTGGAHDEVLDFDTDKGFSTCGPSTTSKVGDAPFAIVSGVNDELLPIENPLRTCGQYLPPADPRRLCDGFYGMASPNTFHGGLHIDEKTDYLASRTWAGNLPLSAWPKNLQTWPGIGGDHWMVLPPFSNGSYPSKNYDPRLSWDDEVLEIRFAWFCEHGAKADLPECANAKPPA